MGMIRIETYGSFPTRDKSFSAQAHGHAQAVAKAIQWLADEVLPEAIERDHRMSDQGIRPDDASFGQVDRLKGEDAPEGPWETETERD